MFDVKVILKMIIMGNIIFIIFLFFDDKMIRRILIHVSITIIIDNLSNSIFELVIIIVRFDIVSIR